MRTMYVFLIFGFLAILSGRAQVKIGDNPQNIDPASVLELESSSRVLVISRMSGAQMNALTPLRGALVFNTDSQCVHYYDGTQWINLCEGLNGTTNESLAIVDGELVLTDSEGNSVSTTLEGVGEQTFTADPIVNFRETIVITQDGNNYNFEVGQITGDQIANSTIQGVDFAPRSITEDKLADFSVNSRIIADGSITVDDMQSPGPDQILSTNSGGFVEWTNQNNIGSDDQQLTLENNIVFLEDGGNINLTPYLDDQDLVEVLGEGTNAGGFQITNLGTPQANNDAATKIYVDNAISGAAQTIVSNNADNSITPGTDGGAFFNATPLQNAINANTTALTQKEDVANKSDNTNLGNSTTLYPTQNAVKVYIDNQIATSGGTTELADGSTIIGDGTAGNEFRVGEIGSPQITNGSILAEDIANNAITTGKIQNGQVLTADLANNSVTTQKIVNGTILGEDIAQQGAAPDQVLKWNGTTWAPANDDGGTGGDGFVSLVEFDGTSLDFTGSGGAFTGGINLSALQSNGSETIINDSPTVTVAGSGTSGDPYILTAAGGGTTFTARNGLSLDASNNLDVNVDNATIEINGANDLQVADLGITTAKLDDGAVNSAKIQNGSIATVDLGNAIVTEINIAPGPDGQYLSTVAGAVAWANLPGGTGGSVEVDGVTIEGNGVSPTPLKVVDGGITDNELAANAVTTVKILDDNVTVEKIAAGTDGQVLITNGTDVQWGNSTAATIVSADLPNSIAAGTDGGALYDDPDDDPANEIELPAGGNNGQILSTDGAGNYAWVDDQDTGGTVVSADLPNSIVAGTDGGALYDDPDDDPANEIELPAGGNNGQILSTDGAGNYAWVDDQDTGGTVVSADLPNSIVAGTDGGALYDDPDDDPANEIELPAGGNNGQILSTDGAGNYAWVDDQDTGGTTPPLVAQGAVYFSNGTSDFAADENNFFWDVASLRLRIGTGTFTPSTKLEVIGNVRANIFKSIDGNNAIPSFTFENDQDNGMYRAGNNQLGFSTGGTAAMLIDAGQNLTVTGSISTVTSGFLHPDYVFQKYFIGFSELDPEYTFQDLHTVETFLKQNHHLPGIKSAAQVKEEGIWNLSESNLKNLEKIEELFLHTIEQEKKIKTLQEQNQALNSELQAIKKDMAEIKAILKAKN